MDYTALIAYFAALTALTAAPGPLVAVLVARSLGKDVKGATAFAVGLCLGDMLDHLIEAAHVLLTLLPFISLLERLGHVVEGLLLIVVDGLEGALDGG